MQEKKTDKTWETILEPRSNLNSILFTNNCFVVITAKILTKLTKEFYKKTIFSIKLQILKFLIW